MKWVLVFSLPFAGPQPRADPWFAKDKWMHFAACAVIQSVAYGVANGGQGHSASLRLGAATAAAFGLGREVHDWRRKSHFSVKDLAWDAAGAGGAAVALHAAR
jgi:uncharacterized protein YfiM (DUF2279 family)